MEPMIVILVILISVPLVLMALGFRRPIFLLSTTLIFLFMFFILLPVFANTPDPDMSIQKLRGLTLEQVQARFGSPVFRDTTKVEDYNHMIEKVTLHYIDRRWYSGVAYDLVFQDNHLTQVFSGSK